MGAGVNEHVLEYIRSKNRFVTLLPGDSFAGLTSATAGTFLLDEGMKITEVLLETSPGESVEEVADFFVDMIVIAHDPRKSTSPAMNGVRASDSPIVVRNFTWTLAEGGQRYIRNRIADAVHTTEVGFGE